jgi:SAM-dependent methyltransferase
MPSRRPSRSKPLPPFDKYQLYHASVQSPDEDARFFAEVYRDARGARAVPKVLREDFCGTFANCCAWLRLGPGRSAHGVDLDPEPLEYGKEHYLSQLSPALAARLRLHRKDVLGSGLPKADIIAALNFSYYIFKDRPTLKKYFTNCRRTLNDGGVLLLDSFGGPKCMEPNEEVSEHGNPPFDYYWDQDTYDPLTNEAQFYIHFKRRGEKKRLKVFSYDWRMWAPAEIKDVLLDAGFSKVDYYWEGSTSDGYGDGDFKVVEHGDECEAYVAYLRALK